MSVLWARIAGQGMFHAWSAAGNYVHSRCGLTRARVRVLEDPLRPGDKDDPASYCRRCGPSPFEEADVAADDKRAQLRDDKGER